MRIASTFIVFTMLSAPCLGAEPGWSTQPTLHGDHVVFVSEGDLFSTRLDGESPAIAHRLTSHDGSERRPHISPDGRWIAFTGEYSGNGDVFLMPAEGGSPVRLTFHPGEDHVVGWSADGTDVLFTSARAHPLSSRELWRVPRSGGMPQRFSFGECSMAAPSSGGGQLAFTRWSNEHWNWKNYRGGTAPEIWIGEPEAGMFRNITGHEANDMFPMWIGGRVYFLSDRTGTPNIWSSDSSGDGVSQVTGFDGTGNGADSFDIRWAGVDTARGGSRIIIEQGGELAIVDAATGDIERPVIHLASDRASSRSRHVDPLGHASSMAISPYGDQLVVTARGDVFVANLDYDTVHRVVSGSDIRERGASFYDDEWLLLVTENEGEQEIAMVPADGSEYPGVLTEGTRSWLFPPLASPDGRWVVYGDRSGALRVIDMNTLEQREVARCEHGEITDYRISPDGRWVAWSMPDANAISQVHISMLEGERTWQVGDGMHHDSEPRWDPAGVYLWFFSDRGLNPRIGNIEFRHTYTQTTRVYALALTEDAPPPDPVAMAAIDFDAGTWSMPPPWEEEFPLEDEMEEAEEADGAPPIEDGVEQEGFEPMRLDTDGMSRRIHPVAMGPGDYGNLEATWGGFLFLSMPPMGLFEEDAAWESGDDGLPSTLYQYDVVSGELNLLADYVDAFVINTDCDVIIAEGEEGYLAVDPVYGEATPLAAAPILMEIDSRQEWAQILDESWRLQRDFFWNPHYNGVDWDAMRTKYAARLDRVGTRTELEDLTGRMLSELQTSHAYTWGGDSAGGADYVPFAMLGADLSPVDDGFRIDSIVPGRSWDEATISPLDQSWLGISVGDVIIAIDGKAVEPGDNPWSLLEGVAGDTVELVIAPGGRWASAYAVDVPLAWDEGALRYQAWVDANRRAVEEASDGRFGYLHLIDMGGAGLSQFAHQYYGQADRDGLVIDVRDNGGGFVSQLILDQLAQEITGYDQPRHGTTSRYPAHAFPGHLVVIINQHAGSDGDIFPYMFREMELGPLVGTRTWGGVVGIRADKESVDDGMTTQPEYATWTVADGWGMENYGVDPDIEVDITPSDRMAGRDTQLERAVQELERMLQAEPVVRPSPPPYPGAE